MKPEQLYDLALARGIANPAVIQLGDRFVVGQWVSVAMLSDSLPRSLQGPWVLRTDTKGVKVIGEGDSWLAAGVAAGLVETSVNLKKRA